RSGDTNTAGSPFEQLNPEAVLYSLQLAGDRALGQSGDFGGLGEAAVFHDQREKRQLIQIKGHSTEKAMHVAHQSMRLMNFTQEYVRGKVVKRERHNYGRKN